MAATKVNRDEQQAGVRIWKKFGHRMCRSRVLYADPVFWESQFERVHCFESLNFNPKSSVNLSFGQGVELLFSQTLIQ